MQRSGCAIQEYPEHQWLSYMADVSRGGAMSVECVKKMIRWLAAMGFNDMML